MAFKNNCYGFIQWGTQDLAWGHTRGSGGVVPPLPTDFYGFHIKTSFHTLFYSRCECYSGFGSYKIIKESTTTPGPGGMALCPSVCANGSLSFFELVSQ